MQHRLKPAARAAGAGIVPPEFFGELHVAVYDPGAALYAGLGQEGLAALAGDLKGSGNEFHAVRRARGLRFREIHCNLG